MDGCDASGVRAPHRNVRFGLYRGVPQPLFLLPARAVLGIAGDSGLAGLARTARKVSTGRVPVNDSAYSRHVGHDACLLRCAPNGWRDPSIWTARSNGGCIKGVMAAASPCPGEWVMLAYRLPREPSGPRTTLWRRLKRLGVAQLADGLVALPADARTREQLEWLAGDVTEANGTAGLWLARPGTIAQERELAAGMASARAAEYEALAAQCRDAAAAGPADPADPADRARALRR